MFLLSLLAAWLLVEFGFFRPPRNVLSCGLAGFSGKRSVDETKLRWLLVMNESRGTDSTGVFGNNTFKSIGKASNFIKSPQFRAAIKGAKTVMGHTRSATAGSVSDENAHPFMYGPEDNEMYKVRCVGAHNGFVISDLDKHHNKELGFEKSFVVDSQILFASLAKFDDVNVISRIEGGIAMSFMFPDKLPDTLFLYRRQDTRPLHIGESNDGLYYCSEKTPLELIGCRSIWTTIPNMLYTIKEGEVLDVYRMPDPVLKSLAVNVTRNNWRQGVPIAEINALPKDVSSALVNTGAGFKHTRSTTTDQSEIDWSSRLGLPKDYPTIRKGGGTHKPNRDSLINGYSNKDSATSVDAKYNLFISNIRDEIKKMQVTPLNINDTKYRDQDDFSACLLTVTVRNKTNNKGLPAWTVISADNGDISGLTSLNGMTLMKVPHAMCGARKKFLAYDPVDQLGPFEFEVTPSTGRVMEVTLSIPFREEEKEIKKESPIGNELERIEASCIAGPHALAIHVPSADGKRNNEGTEGRHSPALSTEGDVLLSGGSEGEQADGEKASSRRTTGFISKGARLPLDREKMVLGISSIEDRCKLIDWLTSTDDYGQYKNWRDMPTDLWLDVNRSEPYTVWKDLYKTSFSAAIDYASLLSDAARLLVWDRSNYKAWSHLDMYIEELLKLRFRDYILPALKGTMYWPPDWYPSVIAGNNKKKVTTPVVVVGKEQSSTSLVRVHLKNRVPYLSFSRFLLWRKKINNIMDLTKKDLKEYEAHTDCLDTLIVNINGVLADDQSSQQDQRVLLMELRSFLRREKEDWDDFVSIANHSLIHKLGLDKSSTVKRPVLNYGPLPEKETSPNLL